MLNENQLYLSVKALVILDHYNFNFGHKNAYHKVFICENSIICIFFINKNYNSN